MMSLPDLDNHEVDALSLNKFEILSLSCKAAEKMCAIFNQLIGFQMHHLPQYVGKNSQILQLASSIFHWPKKSVPNNRAIL